MPEIRIGKGLIRPRDKGARAGGAGAWEIKVDVPRPRGEGDRRTRYIQVRGTRFDAELRLAGLRKALDEETYVDRREMSVRHWLEEWLRDHVAGGVSGKTFERYQDIVRTRLIPAFGTRSLRQLEARHVRAFEKQAQREPRRRMRVDGSVADLPPLTAQTVKHYHRVLSQALKAARQEGLIAHNPVDDVRAPRVEEVEMNTLDQAQTGLLLDAAAKTPIYIPILLAVTTGMRRGEILGLRWRDVDLDAGAVRVTQSLEQTTANGLSFKPPKTARSRRTLPLLPLSLAPLRTHRASQKEDRVKAGSMWADTDLVCCRADGSPIDPDRLSKDFARLVRQLGLGVRLHDLRHTHISQLLDAGVPIAIVSERAGHKNAYVTLAIYSHALRGTQDEAVKRFDDILRPHLRQGGG
jgi:integrase